MKFTIWTDTTGGSASKVDIVETEVGVWVIEAENEQEADKKLEALLRKMANTQYTVRSPDEEEIEDFERIAPQYEERLNAKQETA